jgi:mono/diheme cytochrome c family protein
MRNGPTVFLAIWCLSIGLQSADAQNTIGKTVLDGAYSTEQAARGQVAYTKGCASCHGEDLKGVAGTNAAVLVGDRFLDRWREDDLGELFRFLQISMPSRAASTMTDEAKLDVMAYLLQANKFPAGSTELTAATADNILLVGQDGLKPMPNASAVRAVGCLELAPGSIWTLTHAPELTAARNTEETTPDELKSSASRSSGPLTFKLPGLDFAIPGLKPSEFRGHKVQVKGNVYRQSGNDRINVRSLSSITPQCGN